MSKLPNIRILRSSMRENGWHITAIEFAYNHSDYIVLFEDAGNIPHKYPYTLALITFIDKSDATRKLGVEANAGGFDIENPKDVMDYFMIAHRPSMKGFFESFYEIFNIKMPQRCRNLLDREMILAASTQLSMRDHEDNPSALYCFDVRKNPEGKHRSLYNDNKTRLLRPDLYELLKGEPKFSFYYSDKPSLSLSTQELLERLAQRDYLSFSSSSSSNR